MDRDEVIKKVKSAYEYLQGWRSILNIMATHMDAVFSSNDLNLIARNKEDYRRAIIMVQGGIDMTLEEHDKLLYDLKSGEVDGIEVL